MSREKPDSDNRRTIIELSRPIEASVNNFTKVNVYLNTVYKLQYLRVDNITETLLRLGSEAVIYKIDLLRTFRQLRIDPHDYNLLTLKWGSQLLRRYVVSVRTQKWEYDVFKLEPFLQVYHV